MAGFTPVFSQRDAWGTFINQPGGEMGIPISCEILCHSYLPGLSQDLFGNLVHGRVKLQRSESQDKHHAASPYCVGWR